jgi:SAM-dependent methyltransferase
MDQSNRYRNITTALKKAYDFMAEERNRGEIPDWKVIERQRFLAEMQKAGSRSLLEIGAGHGRDSLFFQEQGLQVTCVDLSAEMVVLCRAKGLKAYACDLFNMPFGPDSFDAVYTMNSLLHIPRASIHSALEKIGLLLKPGGLFYYGVYGGKDIEGIWEDDAYQPKRFFNYYTDEDLPLLVSAYFDVVSFQAVDLSDRSGLHFQSMILRKAPGETG